MKTYICLLLLSGSLISFALNSCGKNNDRAEKRIKNQVTAVAEDYITSQLTTKVKQVSESGVIMIGDDQKRYIIDPGKIFTGIIDDDNTVDAVVSVAVFQEQYQIVSEQLIILNIEGRFTMVRALESDMRIISLNDRIITADVPEHSRDNPLFNCRSCWEVVRFQYRTGELVRIE